MLERSTNPNTQQQVSLTPVTLIRHTTTDVGWDGVRMHQMLGRLKIKALEACQARAPPSKHIEQMGHACGMEYWAGMEASDMAARGAACDEIQVSGQGQTLSHTHCAEDPTPCTRGPSARTASRATRSSGAIFLIACASASSASSALRSSSLPPLLQQWQQRAADVCALGMMQTPEV